MMASKMTFVLTQIDKGSPEDSVAAEWNVKLEEGGEVVFDDINTKGRDLA